ncbi:MAG: sterol desaturase family protein [Bacteroidota bacterium]
MAEVTEQAIKPNNKGTKKLFENKLLEKLTRTHIAVPISIFIVYSAGLLYWSIASAGLSALFTTALFFIGVITFTLVEYLAHRYIFHMSTHTKLRAKMQYAFHGVHHEYPKDKDRLAMPPILSVTIATILLLLFKLIMGNLAFGFLPGFLVGYCGYLFVHYIVHAYQPPKNVFKALWVNHGIHHYKHHDKVFGVSSPLWDYIFGTMPK